MLEIIPHGTRIGFIRLFPKALVFSALLLALGLGSLVIQGPSYGIDFSGGTVVHVRFAHPVKIAAVRDALATIASGEFTVQDFGGGASEFLVRLPEADPRLREGVPKRVEVALGERFGVESGLEILRVESVGPRVGQDLRRRGILAVLAATLMMGVYIAIRFELRFGIGAAVALLHDSLITIGALSLMGYEFDLTIVAGLLTVIGYSVNDTVIVSDRIRENLGARRRETLAEVVERSINETLSRTVMTTVTALLVIVALYLLGGAVIHGFAFTLLVGFVVGTYSSIFIASPIVLYLAPAKK